MIRIGPETSPYPISGRVERRLVGQALAFWLYKRKTRPFPELEDIQLDDPGAGAGNNLLRHFFVLDAAERLEKSFLSYCGKVPESLGQGKISETPACNWFPPTLWASFYFVVRAALDAGKPLATSGRFITFDESNGIHRSVIMPLGNGKEKPGRVLGAVSYKLFPAS